MDTIEIWRRRYLQAGVTTIPLPSFTKSAAYSWTTVTPADAWHEYGSTAGNIGILAGNTLAIIDQDTEIATRMIDTWAGALGVELPTVYSATPGHRQSYIRCLDVPDGFTVAKLDVDAVSDFRAHSAYAVAPPSAVYIGDDLRRYRWKDTRTMERDVQLLMVQRAIKWRDLEPLLLRKPGDTGELLDAPPLRLLWRPAPGALAGLAQVSRFPEGVRSELEAGAVCSLIASGWDFGEIAAAFAEIRPGHYATKNRSNAERYLWHTWRTACTFLAAQGSRRDIAASYHAASSAPWPGRSGASDRGVYLGVLAIAWEHNDWTVAASVRDLAQYAAISPKTVSYALRRLRRDYGLLQQVHDAESGPYGGYVYRVSPFVAKGNISHSIGSSIEGSSSPSSQTVEFNHTPAPRGQSEVWAWARLGKSAGLVYRALADTPQSATDLVTATGKHRATVFRALATLQVHGLADDTCDGWQRGPVELAEVAQLLDCEQAAVRRRAEHERQREAWQRRALAYEPDETQAAAVTHLASDLGAGLDAVLGPDWREGADMSP